MERRRRQTGQKTDQILLLLSFSSLHMCDFQTSDYHIDVGHSEAGAELGNPDNSRHQGLNSEARSPCPSGRISLDQTSSSSSRLSWHKVILRQSFKSSTSFQSVPTVSSKKSKRKSSQYEHDCGNTNRIYFYFHSSVDYFLV